MLIHMFPIRNPGLLLRRSAILNRSFYSGNLVYRTERLIGPCYMKSKNVVSPMFKRSFASSNSSYSFPIRSLVFFTLSSLGIVGGFYVISYSLRSSNVFKAGMDLVERCPEVIEITGSPVVRKGLVKGKMSSGVADMHFVVRGPKGQLVVNIAGTVREGSKTEYDLKSVKASNRSKDDEVEIMLYDNYEPKLEFTPKPVVVSEDGASVPSETQQEKPVKYGFFLDKPWYYRIGLAVLAGATMGVVLSMMILNSRQAPKNSSAYQSLLVLLRENKMASDILGDGIKSAGKMVGKSEENWANFSIRMSGKKSTANVNCQAFRQGNNWRFTVVSLDTPTGRVYLCK